MIPEKKEQAIDEAWVPLHLRVDVFLETNFLPLKKVVFRCFFKESIFQSNGRLLPIACHTYLESYDTQLSFGLS